MAPSSSSSTFRVRLNCIDHYQSKPSDLDPDFGFDKNQAYKVPVIRIFGATETGQKVCAHVHGCLPYLYIDYEGSSLRQQDVDVFIHRFRMSVDHALAVSYRRDKDGAKAVFVAHISLVKGIPFFGYHVGYRPYLKIYLLNPLHITRLADLFRQGAVMASVIQPYESHMQYVPQWMTDYNLYGCAYLDCRRVRFRLPVPSVHEVDVNRHKWHSMTIPKHSISDDMSFQRQSRCAIEVDVCVQDILNRSAVGERPLHHDFQEAMRPPVYKEKLVPSMGDLWRDESRRRRLKMGILDPDSSPFDPDILVSVSAEAREDSGEWVHEEEYRQHVRRVAAREMEKSGRKTVTYSDFQLGNSRLDGLKTAFESIEDLYPAQLHDTLVSQSAGEAEESDSNGGTSFDVDEFKIRSFGDFSEIDDLDVPSNSTPSKRKDQSPSKRAAAASAVLGDLANMGVRLAGDYSNDEEEAFELPEEYAESVASSTPNRNGQKRTLDQLSGSIKRQKLMSDPQHAAADTLKNTSFDAPETPSFTSVTDAISPSSDRFNERMKKIASQVADRLAYPVVKDPNDSNTIRRLSQKSTDQSDTPRAGESYNSLSDLEASTADKSTLSGFPSASQSSSTTNEIPPSTQPVRKPEWRYRHLDGFEVGALCLKSRPPSVAQVRKDLTAPGGVAEIYKEAHYSNEADVPGRKFAYGGREYFPGSYSTPYLPNFDPLDELLQKAPDQPMRFPDHKSDEKVYKQCRQQCSLKSWEIDRLPPSRADVEQWLAEQKGQQQQHQAAANGAGGKRVQLRREQSSKFDSTQVAANTQINNGAKYFQTAQPNTSVQHETQYMSVMTLEVHVNTRRTLVPNPEQDELAAVFWRLKDDSQPLDASGATFTRAGIIVLSAAGKRFGRRISQMTGVEIVEEESELDVLNRVIDTVRELDPDIISGFEVHGGSWGYVIERARLKFEWNICDELSRVKSDSHGRFGRADDKWGFNQTSTLRVTGRHTINIWRAMQNEINLLQYTMENIIFHLFNKRVPHYAYSDLTRWWTSDDATDLGKVVTYLLDRTQHDLDILDKNDLVPRTSEQARLLGVDFYSVFSRGSQFKVESLMFRIAKPENFILVSPSRKQVGGQNALECLPLVMEPQSGFYSSPLLVLDFQSLYPSVMIAYNYCYSTFLGRIVDWRGRNKMGFANYERQEQLLELLKDYINIAPNGMMYCKPNVRKSLLAKMLGEILETRVMVKSGMKKDKDDKTLQRLLNNRQLALKFIANVTYGYTSASFSGRMPCAEIADSIVQTGRETLEKAIMLIHSVQKWGAEVVYGDTDSLFVYLKGKTRDQAFDIGQEIVDSITAVNPKPIKLKFEKVYHPCVLLAKKRYVGFKYEYRKQKEPEFDAKGIETVRRDGTPAEQRIEEKALKTLFRTQDLSQVKRYFQHQCAKIMRGNVSIQDFCFAREVRLGTYSDRGPPPPGALISTRRMLEDPRAEPQYGERVPYVVVTGAPGARLIDRCVAPEELLRKPHLELDADYYISKNLIPPLERIFNLVGGNVRQWYDEMPKFQRARAVPIGLGSSSSSSSNSNNSTRPRPKPFFSTSRTPSNTADNPHSANRSLMENYLRRTSCIVCNSKLTAANSRAPKKPVRRFGIFGHPIPEHTILAEEQKRKQNEKNDGTEQLCTRCASQKHVAALKLQTRLNNAEGEVVELERVCRSCAGLRPGEEVRCDSKACPVFYSRTRHRTALEGQRALLEPVLRGLREGLLEW